MLKPLQPQPGSTIDPRNAVGRTTTTLRAQRELLAGNNLGINDPRRMGKTVWLDLFCADPGSGLKAVKIDYEGVRSSSEFLHRTLEAVRGFRGLSARGLELLRALFDGLEVQAGPISVRPGVASRTPTDLITQAIRAVDAHLDGDELLVIAMDEVPLAIDNIGHNEGAPAASQLLQILRNLRREARSLRWIVCGSVGFHHILDRCGATEGVINDLVNLPLGPLEDHDARELAERLFLGIECQADPDGVAAMLEHSGGVPFLIHALAHILNDGRTGRVSPADVAAAFVAFMDDRDDSRAATHLVTRLQPYYGNDAALAEAVLDRTATQGPMSPAELHATVASADAALDVVLNHLLDDHYLLHRGGQLSWRYDVLRRIWVHRRQL